VRLSPLGTSATNWLILPAPDDKWWVWNSRWNESWQGKPKYSEKTCSSASLSTTNPTWPDLGSNPGRSGGKPATNHLSYDTAHYWKVCPSVRILACGFETTGLHCITVAKRVRGCRKNILDAPFVPDMELQFPGLHDHLTWVPSIFLSFCYLKTNVYASTIGTRAGLCGRNQIYCKWNKE
jgi:hypothetical protein